MIVKADKMLVELGVTMSPTSPDFLSWISKTYPDWKFASIHFESLPKENVSLVIGEYTVAYLFSEDVIVENSLRCVESGLIVMAALPDGSWLAMDTTSIIQSIGKIAIRWLIDDESKIPRRAFRSFDMNYGAWLSLMIEDPGNTDFG